MNAKKLIAASVAALLVAAAEAAASFLTVTNVTCRQRYPWNGKVDVDFEVLCNDAKTNVNLFVSATDAQRAKSLAVKTVTCADNVATNAGELAVRAGKHRLVWDFGTDNPNVVSTNVVVSVQGLLGSGLYMVIDLSGGISAASYPVSYLGAPPSGGWTDEYKTTKLVLRRIQPGTFTMGSPSGEVGRYSDEVQHEVTLTKPFYMGVFQVTQRQWELVMGANPSYFSNASYYAARPVECVSWNMIRGNSSSYNWPKNQAVDPNTFIGRLRTKAGLEGCDLPTEAQWEYACRAGTTTALNSGKNLTSTSSYEYRNYANMNEVGRYRNNGGGPLYSAGYTYTTAKGTNKAGSYAPNAWGLYDMHGNVDEWCLDWYGAYSGTATDPVGAASGSGRVQRGGSCSHDSCGCRSAYRGNDNPSSGNSNYGFRLCCGSAGL